MIRLTILFLLISAVCFGQPQKISEMTNAGALGGTEFIPIVQSGANRKATPLQLSTYALTTPADHSVIEISLSPRTDSVTTSNIGKIAFDATDDKIRFNDGTGWYSYLREGTLTASNGVTKVGNDFRLGTGTLASGITWTNNSDFYISNSSTATYTNDFFHSGGGYSFFTHGIPFTALNEYSMYGGFDATVSVWGGIQIADDRVRIGSGPASNAFTSYIDFLYTGEAIINPVTNGTALFLGLRYPSGYDSTEWLPETLVTKGYVDGSIEDITSDFMPLTGTADLTGNTVIDGNNFDLTFGSTNALDDFVVIADNSVEMRYATGTSINRIRSAAGATTISASTDSETTVSSIIIQQTGSGDDIQFTVGNSTVFVIEADGDIRTPSLPTDCTGKATGTWWNDSGAVKLCP